MRYCVHCPIHHYIHRGGRMDSRMLFTAVFAVLLFGCADEATDEPTGPDVVLFPYAEWSDSAMVKLNTTESGAGVAGDVTGFPVLLRLHANVFPSFDSVASGGADLRFNTAAGVPMPYEVEYWDDDSIAYVWVLVDTVHGDDSTQFFYMYWGNLSAVSESDGTAVFAVDNGFQGVWHLEDYTDATARARDAVAKIASTDRTGMIGRGQLFTEVNGDSLIVESGANTTNEFTLSGWARTHNVNYQSGSVISVLWSYDIDADLGYALRVLQSQIGVITGPPGSWAAKTGCAYPGQWVHVATTFKNGTLTLYCNGEAVHAVAGQAFQHSADTWTCIGGSGEANSNTPMDARADLDEVRESNVARSGDWIMLSVANQRDSLGIDALVSFESIP
ncbi:MAG: DUF2341 domain-containing protein [Chitinivibrionales bacterium]|nr:DUF2341 domain-containing protein [Chitinivibrionales bacterium]